MVSFSNGEVLDIDSPDGAYTYVCNVLMNLGVGGSVLSCMETLKPEKCPYRIDRMLKTSEELERELAVARKGLEAVESLMNESHGVVGLHLNGDFAPWSELRTGGRFEEWLVAFDDALNAARSSNPKVSHDGDGGRL